MKEIIVPFTVQPVRNASGTQRQFCDKTPLHFKNTGNVSIGIPFTSAPARIPRPGVGKFYIPMTGFWVPNVLQVRKKVNVIF
jgi:hypothetical protein